MQDGPIIEAISALRALAAHNVAAVQGPVDTYFTDVDALEPIDPDELLARMSADSITLLDVRPADEFRAGHLAGAMNIDIALLAERRAELPRDREIIRGHYCVLSLQAVQALREQGYKVRHLRDGLPEWRTAGHQVETT